MTLQPGRATAAGEQAIDRFLAQAHLAAQHDLPQIIAENAALLGAAGAVAYLADLQQTTLVAFVADPQYTRIAPLSIDATLAGRAFQYLTPTVHERGDPETSSPGDSETARVWLPLVDGTERLGVLALDLATDDAARIGEEDNPWSMRVHRFASLVAEVIMTKTMYGDLIVNLRRRADMSLAAEMQWGLLPPLTFACHRVTVSGVLEPAYRVAGDTFDYAVDAGRAKAAVLDGMGHGLRSTQLAVVAIGAYRNARRGGLGLIETAQVMHEALDEAFEGTTFATGLLAELDTDAGTLSWVNAGHPPPLLVRGGRVIKSLSCPPAPPLGMGLPPQDRRPFSACQESLEPGDRIVLYTDGVTEARSPDGEFFGDQRLTDLLVRNLAAGLPAPETMRRIVRALLRHQHDKLSDDATLLMIEWRGDLEGIIP